MKIAANKNLTKVLASVVLLGGAAGVAGLGTFGAFTSTTSASETVTAGRVVIDLTQDAGHGMNVAATNMVPGDTIQRAVVLTRSSTTEAFGSVKLTTSTAGSNLLTSDATNGLQVKVDQCDAAWTQVGTTSELACAGGSTPVVAQRAVIGSLVDLGAATTKLNSAAAASNLRVQLSLPGTADNAFQGMSNTVTFTFDATQRSGDFK